MKNYTSLRNTAYICFGFFYLIIIIGCIRSNDTPSIAPSRTSSPTNGSENSNQNAGAVATATRSLDNNEVENIEARPTVVGATESEDISIQSLLTPTLESEESFRGVFYSDISEDFSLHNSNHTTPMDVLREISYSGGFGGGGNNCYLATPGTIYVDSANPDLETRVEWYQPLRITTCGWLAGEEVEITLNSPSNELVLKSDRIGDEFGVEFQYTPEINFEPGTYEVKFSGDSGTLTIPVNFILPETPRLYSKDNSLILYNFGANEIVRLLVYSRVQESGPPLFYPQFFTDIYGYAELVGWEQYQVNDEGQLLIDISEDQNSGYEFIILGEESGEVSIFPWEPFDLNGVATSEYDVHPYKPNPDEIDETDSIWSHLSYQDLVTPGVQEYDIALQNGKWIWGFTWCGANENILDEILLPLSLELLINDVQLAASQIHEYRFTANDGWECQSWKVVLENWPINEIVNLEIVYNLKENIFDGSQIYPAGGYKQIIHVQVEY